MSKFRFHLSVSADGYLAGPDQSEENPLGVGGEQLHEWVVQLEAWRKPHGKEGGEVNASTQVVEEVEANVGAGVMGRNMFGPVAGGDWGDESLEGLVGRRSSVPPSGLRAHPSRARAPGDGGRHHLHLRHRRHRIGLGAGEGRRGWQGRPAPRWCRASRSSISPQA